VAGLGVGSPSVRAAAGTLLSAEHWDAHFAGEGAPVLPAGVDDRERIARGIQALWQRDAEGTLCMTHGDAHVGNTYIDADGDPGFLDWQCIGRAPSLYDVAYFVIGALDVEDRRSTEEQLLRHYLRVLGADGGPELSFDEAWLDYQRYALHGFFWALTPPVMQTPARVRAMADRYTAAIADHDSLSLLGV
jgi:aminoglycoside phosphotransferase (APT) family kinase protein